MCRCPLKRSRRDLHTNAAFGNCCQLTATHEQGSSSVRSQQGTVITATHLQAYIVPSLTPYAGACTPAVLTINLGACGLVATTPLFAARARRELWRALCCVRAALPAMIDRLRSGGVFTVLK
jgi:hypothetical protein